MKKRLLEAAQRELHDGIVFGGSKITDLDIINGDYGGVRLIVKFQLDVSEISKTKLSKLSSIHLDVAFDPLTLENLTKIDLPPLIDADEFRISWSVYPSEFIFAEKLQTLVARGSRSSRGKDIYDMWLLSTKIKDEIKLRSAVEKVFLERETDVPKNFSQFLSTLDLSILRGSWGAVSLRQPKDFDETFSQLTHFLGKF